MSTYIVQSIIDRRGHEKNQRQYLIKWKGYSISDSTWQPIKNLIYVKQMIMDFDEQYDRKDQKKELQTNYEGNNELRKLPLKEQQGRRSNRGKAKKVPIENEGRQQKRQSKKQNTLRNIKGNINDFSEQSKEQSIHSKYLATLHHQPQINSLNVLTSNMKLEENSDKTDKITDEGNISKEDKREAPLIKNTNQERLQILGMRKNEIGEYFFLVQSSTGLTSYKTRQYLVKNYPESLIIFYESKMIFVEDKNLH